MRCIDYSFYLRIIHKKFTLIPQMYTGFCIYWIWDSRSCSVSSRTNERPTYGRQKYKGLSRYLRSEIVVYILTSIFFVLGQYYRLVGRLKCLKLDRSSSKLKKKLEIMLVSTFHPFILIFLNRISKGTQILLRNDQSILWIAYIY